MLTIPKVMLEVLKIEKLKTTEEFLALFDQGIGTSIQSGRQTGKTFINKLMLELILKRMLELNLTDLTVNPSQAIKLVGMCQHYGVKIDPAFQFQTTT